MATNDLNFDPTKFTSARLQTEGWMKFTDPPEKVFALLADHKGMTQWLPLLKKVTVTHTQEVAPGESAVGTARKMVFEGGITLVETVVFWNPPLCYAYDTNVALAHRARSAVRAIRQILRKSPRTVCATTVSTTPHSARRRARHC